MRNLDGTAQIDVVQGQLGGIDLEFALHRIDKSPLALLTDIRRGRTAFDHASFGLRFVKGVASIEEGKLESPSLRLGLGGTVDFGERGLDLHAIAKPAADAARRARKSRIFASILAALGTIWRLRRMCTALFAGPVRRRRCFRNSATASLSPRAGRWTISSIPVVVSAGVVRIGLPREALLRRYYVQQ